MAVAQRPGPPCCNCRCTPGPDHGLGDDPPPWLALWSHREGDHLFALNVASP